MRTGKTPITWGFSFWGDKKARRAGGTRTTYQEISIFLSPSTVNLPDAIQFFAQAVA